MGLQSLIRLVISRNPLNTIYYHGFEGLHNLTELLLHGICIARIGPGTFKNMKQVTTLDLSCSCIRTVTSGAFNGLHGIHAVNLTGNIMDKTKYNDVCFLTSLELFYSDHFQFCCFLIGVVDCFPNPRHFLYCSCLLPRIGYKIVLSVVSSIWVTMNTIVLIINVRFTTLQCKYT